MQQAGMTRHSGTTKGKATAASANASQGPATSSLARLGRTGAVIASKAAVAIAIAMSASCHCRGFALHAGSLMLGHIM
jgi:hypothetical protein